ncbi:hypothetical protein, partial [Ectobacillus funiculus]
TSFLDYGLCGNYHYTRIWGGTPFLCSKNPWHARAEDYEIDSIKKIERQYIKHCIWTYKYIIC